MRLEPVLLFAATLFAAPAASAQPVRHAVAGYVRDTAGTGIDEATITVRGTYWSVISRADGRFALALPAGTWTLLVRRIGFASSAVHVIVCDTCRTDMLRLILVPRAVALEGITVEAEGAHPFTEAVTRETIRQLPALIEPDLFRAIVVLPGVSQPNDLNGRVHLAGGASDETAIRLDGHPLQDPFHLLGIFGAFNTEALERADIHIHHLDALVGDALSGTIEMFTRQPRGRPSGGVGASLLAAHGVVTWPALPGSMDVLAAGRITYIGTIADAVASRASDLPIPNYFDGIVRLGRSLGANGRVELLGFTTHDDIHTANEAGVPISWGEALIGARLTSAVGGAQVAARVGFNHASTKFDRPPDAAGGDTLRLGRDWLSAAVAVTRTARRWRATSGIDLDVRRIDDHWRLVTLDRKIISAPARSAFALRDALTMGAAFGSGSFDAGAHLAATVGARAIAVDGQVRLAPRVALWYRPAATWNAELAYDRRYQFSAQAEDPVVGSIT